MQGLLRHKRTIGRRPLGRNDSDLSGRYRGVYPVIAAAALIHYLCPDWTAGAKWGVLATLAIPAKGAFGWEHIITLSVAVLVAVYTALDRCLTLWQRWWDIHRTRIEVERLKQGLPSETLGVQREDGGTTLRDPCLAKEHLILEQDVGHCEQLSHTDMAVDFLVLVKTHQIVDSGEATKRFPKEVVISVGVKCSSNQAIKTDMLFFCVIE